MTATVTETQPPDKTPGWVHGWERGTDPWHPDAFVGTPAEGMWSTTESRKTGWYAVDWCGNVVGFVPDGYVCTEWPQVPKQTD